MVRIFPNPPYSSIRNGRGAHWSKDVALFALCCSWQLPELQIIVSSFGFTALQTTRLGWRWWYSWNWDHLDWRYSDCSHSEQYLHSGSTICSSIESWDFPDFDMFGCWHHWIRLSTILVVDRNTRSHQASHCHCYRGDDVGPFMWKAKYKNLSELHF